MNVSKVIEVLAHNWGKITINSYGEKGLSFALYDDARGAEKFSCESEGITLGYCLEEVIDQIEKQFYPQKDRMIKLSLAKKEPK